MTIQEASRSPSYNETPENKNIYIVEKGDSLSKIANKKGIDISEIIKANESITKENKDNIKIGQKIIIPKKAIILPSTPERLELSMETASDYGLEEGTTASFFGMRNKKGEELFSKYEKTPEELSKNEKIQLANYLIDKSESNKSFYTIKNYINAAKLNPNKYSEIAEKKVLNYATDTGWSYEVVSNLKELGLTENEIKQEIFGVVDNLLAIGIKQGGKDDNTFFFRSKAEVLIVSLVKFGEDGNKKINQLRQLVEEIKIKGYSTPLKDFNDKFFIEKTYGDLILRGASSGSGDGIQNFQIKKNGEIFTVFYKNSDNLIEVPEKDYTTNGKINYKKKGEIKQNFIQKFKEKQNMSEKKENYSPSNKEKINNKEKLTNKDILLFRNIAKNSYKETYENNDSGVNKAIISLEKQLLEFKKIIESKGLNVNGNNFEELAKNITAYFSMVGYIFKPGVTPIGNGKLGLSLSLYKELSSSEENLNDFSLFGKIEKSVKINYVETTIGSYQNYKGFVNDGLTIMGKNGNNQVLIFPKNIKSEAKRQGITNIDNYQESVEINELSQVYFSNFIDNKFLSVKLNDFIEVPNKSWTLHHVLEAYSDYETLKQGDFFEEEVKRIKNSKAYNYNFSKTIINAAINIYNQNIENGDKTPLKTIVLESYEENIKGVVNAFNGYLEFMRTKYKKK